MHITLIGTEGMLNRAWCELLAAQGLAFRNLGLPDLDYTRPESIAPALGENPGTVINCAAYTDVDGAETNEPLATAINGTGVGTLAEVCRARGSLLVHYSTDYVFDGAASSPYRVDAPRRPMGAYGRSKAVGEELIERSGCRYLILRTSWLYAPWGKNFVRTIVAAAHKGRPLRVVGDQRGRPTSAEELARTSLQLLQAGSQGILHATDAGECSWYEFAREIVHRAGLGTAVQPCTTAEYPRPAPRPAYSVLDLRPAEAIIGPLRSWQATLAEVMPRLET
jgi:dTDP-4-dehydrorhamnose reductase